MFCMKKAVMGKQIKLTVKLMCGGSVLNLPNVPKCKIILHFLTSKFNFYYNNLTNNFFKNLK